MRIELRPDGRTIEVERGTPLRDVLYVYGVEFPCGGRGRCKRCRIRVVKGELAVTPEEEAILTPAERAQGWRLACRSLAEEWIWAPPPWWRSSSTCRRGE
ncbi:MAG: 2Fe-2S iron-sulfur cluster binding domain-containing protein [Deltaproteobacteria bacterium]|nr:2Fe-2S iron-sulfur cluster binding domain-containing protein [Deltaproteobacteria bacterium]